MSDNEALAKTWSAQSNRLRANLENSDIKDFVIGRTQKPVEVETQCDQLDHQLGNMGIENQEMIL